MGECYSNGMGVSTRNSQTQISFSFRFIGRNQPISDVEEYLLGLQSKEEFDIGEPPEQMELTRPPEPPPVQIQHRTTQGDIYIGELNAIGRYEGNGTYINYQNTFSYTGQFQNGRAQGYGNCVYYQGGTPVKSMVGTFTGNQFIEGTISRQAKNSKQRPNINGMEDEQIKEDGMEQLLHQNDPIDIQINM